VRLDELQRVFGGHIRDYQGRRWLDASIGGLRAFVVRRANDQGDETFDLAIFTPHTRERDPFFSRDSGHLWRLDGDPVLPVLSAGFVFTGCHRGVLFARDTGQASLSELIGALWELARFAREPWRPVIFKRDSAWTRWRKRVVDRVLRPGWVMIALVVVIVLGSLRDRALDAIPI